jgi:hypothetical protein
MLYGDFVAEIGKTDVRGADGGVAELASLPEEEEVVVVVELLSAAPPADRGEGSVVGASVDGWDGVSGFEKSPGVQKKQSPSLLAATAVVPSLAIETERKGTSPPGRTLVCCSFFATKSNVRMSPL